MTLTSEPDVPMDDCLVGSALKDCSSFLILQIPHGHKHRWFTPGARTHHLHHEALLEIIILKAVVLPIDRDTRMVPYDQL